MCGLVFNIFVWLIWGNFGRTNAAGATDNYDIFGSDNSDGYGKEYLSVFFENSESNSFQRTLLFNGSVDAYKKDSLKEIFSNRSIDSE